MKSHKIIVILFVFTCLLLFGCTTLPSSDTNTPVACTMDAKICPDGSAVGRIAPNCDFAPCPDTNRVVGGDKDEHGCIHSAGYSWCEEKQKCLRIWEEDCNTIQIPKDCISWYDGCNTCGAENGELTMCTLMYCETPSKPYCKEYANDTKIIGMPNPASTNCIDNNGTLTIVDTNEGQVGMCKLPNGKLCEEWAYFRGECS
jgi:putative hemolysin